MYKMVILITTHTESSLRVADEWQKGGAPGVTIIDAHGVHSLRRQKNQTAPELSLAVSMAGILSHLRETNVMLFSVVDENLVDPLIEIAQSIIGDLNQPDNGIAFVVDVERVIGLRKRT